MRTSRTRGNPVIGEIIDAISGCVGRIKREDQKKRDIGIQFEYYEPDHKKLMSSPVFMMYPPAAVYCGWNLLKRGIADYLKHFIGLE